MKVQDFKLIANLPERYEYKLFEQEDSILVVGVKYQSVIAFRIKDEKLFPIDLSLVTYPAVGDV